MKLPTADVVPVRTIVFPLIEAVVPVGSPVIAPKANGAVPLTTMFPVTLFPTCTLPPNELEERVTFTQLLTAVPLTVALELIFTPLQYIAYWKLHVVEVGVTVAIPDTDDRETVAPTGAPSNM